MSTPESRTTDSRLVTEAYILRSKAADPNDGRCLVENCSIHRNIQYCHVLSRSYKSNETPISSLEWYWKMRKGTLNIDTRYNVFPAGASVHGMYDKGQWILVPDDTIVHMYYNTLRQDTRTTDRSAYQDVPNGTFNYTLIPLRNMEEVAITRQNNTMIPVRLDAFEVHIYPFTSLPKLHSHVHPKFTIIAAGDQMRKLPESVRNKLLDEFSILAEVFAVYVAWTFPISGRVGRADNSYFPPHPGNDDDEFHDEGSENAPSSTAVGRTGACKRCRSKHPASRSAGGPGQGSKQSVGRGVRSPGVEGTDSLAHQIVAKRKRDSGLSEKVVAKHTKKVGKAEWDNDSLMEWSQKVEPNYLVPNMEC
ncbi:hypothetical protein BDQ17DRAFT_1426711 [Cyathus striatus]|nr:hypothetical protein BDQ17DRAFT_1426711 [Cyathus striatus]